MKFYTGIGSRETPPDLQKIMQSIANALANDNWILRSGGAEGADSAFEAGAAQKRIYLPWNSFNGKIVDGINYIVPPYDESWVMDYHPDADYLSPSAKKLMSRNTYQVLGDDLKSPSSFIVCWTQGGKLKGGTAQALRIAADYKIPRYNIYSDSALQQLCSDYNITLA